MGGRTMPTECEHGVTIDWGDFGPDPDDGSVGAEVCAQCHAEDDDPWDSPVRITEITPEQYASVLAVVDGPPFECGPWCIHDDEDDQ